MECFRRSNDSVNYTELNCRNGIYLSDVSDIRFLKQFLFHLILGSEIQKKTEHMRKYLTNVMKKLCRGIKSPNYASCALNSNKH